MDIKKPAILVKKFMCEKCNFKCSNKYDYNIHLSTAKHKRLHNDISFSQNPPKDEFICSCGKEYKHSSGLWRHKQGCKPNDILMTELLKQNNDLLLQNQELKELITEQKEIILEQKEVFIEQIEYNKQLLGIAKEQKEIAHEQKELAKETKYLAQDQAEEQQEHNKRVLELAQEQKELAQETKDIAQEQKELTIEQAEQTKILMEQIKEKGLGGGGTIINNTTNNTFNLNNYLTVTCKDAMNLKELIEMVQQYDIPNKLIEMFEHGTHSSGVNRVMDEILNEIPVNKRPIHCSDLKREVLHIKSNDSWEKEDNNGAKLLAISFIEHIKHRVFGETLRWKNDVLNPNSDKDDDRYTRVLTQMIGPHSKTEAFVREKEKIKVHLAKKTLIAKM